MSTLGNFVWGIADALRGPYKPHQYGDVILPMTILRRLDAMLAPTRDEVAKLVAANPNPDLAAARIKQQLGLGFFNTSKWTLIKLQGDPDNLADNLVDYISGFSKNIDVFTEFKFDQTIHDLADKDRLLIVVQEFAKVDLSPAKIDNAAMGDLFEELIRKFADASNETAGEHFTPRDAIRLLVDLLFAEDDEALATANTVRSVYDPTAGTGGMLSIAEEHLRALNPDARLRLYGQEINPQSYAIAKSDMIAKGQNAENIKRGDTLREDKFAGTTFDYCLSNPPYGVDWKTAQADVKAENQNLGQASRFHAGLPAVSDGQMLFLQHLVSKMRPAKDGGGRAGIVLNGSPLFNGGAESGPSNIRRWLLESDLVDAIVALPTEMFYNTGIATYVWILDNKKPAERVGTVQLIDGTDFYAKMRKSLGSKRREITEAQRAQLVQMYSEHNQGEKSKIFRTDEFGYWTITVERSLVDEDGNPVTDRKGNPKPDPKLRDTENVPFTYNGNADGDAGRDVTVKAYMESEVLPHVPDAWVDAKKTKIGYEIPFTRHFYTYIPPRPLAEIDADLKTQVAKIMDMLREVEA
ncbi:SAM-dependent DNA methyltransferase [Nocardioides sp. Y6]|uniref:site-specific DNA-methyltransferase (adenine-specific) n=1 Tax=Nocardioides malaquae TaxID=2773426 RepID=A0ABR9RSE1_9ACTN|nr:class I SAM-dependent DNA methyltransferase [Nocardioides malaquae]MBE7324502.1 SAM-dependent DNA methyltransferase [Nocardioides malaquae]